MPPRREKPGGPSPQSRSKSGQHSKQASTHLKDAQALHQQASRRKGADALGRYEAAAVAYRTAVAANQAAETAGAHMESLFGLADCLQGWACAMDAACQALPDGQLTAAAESSCQSSMISLYAEALPALHQVIAGTTGELRGDACINLGNTCCAWAELIAPSGESRSHLQEALQAYQEAAIQDPEDAAIWSNTGDALVSLGEQLSEAGRMEEGQVHFQRAMQAYSHSCSLSDSQQGDDLPGLLHNWGVGLHCFASQSQDLAQALSLWSEAEMRLRSAAALDVGDAAPLNALGDVHSGRAERLLPVQPTEAAKALQAALADGYGRALKIHGQDLDALLGMGEAQLSLGRLAAAEGELSGAHAAFTAAIQAYEKALQALNGQGKLQDRCNARYNAACALSLGGRQAEARQLLKQLLALSFISVEDVASDPDLQNVSEALKPVELN